MWDHHAKTRALNQHINIRILPNMISGIFLSIGPWNEPESEILLFM